MFVTFCYVNYFRIKILRPGDHVQSAGAFAAVTVLSSRRLNNRLRPFNDKKLNSLSNIPLHLFSAGIIIQPHTFN